MHIFYLQKDVYLFYFIKKVNLSFKDDKNKAFCIQTILYHESRLTSREQQSEKQ